MPFTLGDYIPSQKMLGVEQMLCWKYILPDIQGKL